LSGNSLTRFELINAGLQSVPSWICNATSNIYHLSLASNPISSISCLLNRTLVTLNLSGCSLTTVPPLTGMGVLRHLDLSNNFLSGPFPSYLFNQLSSLSTLCIGKNKFDPFLPSDAFSGMLSLEVLDISGCAFSGPFPNGNLNTFFRSLNASNNQFTAIPITLLGMSFLDLLDFSHNDLRGLPTTSGLRSPVASVVNLSWNPKLGGTQLPNWALGARVEARLAGCGFTGSVPRFDLAAPALCDLSHNWLTGSLQDGYDAIATLDLSYNQISGSIPNPFWQNTQVLRLSHNNLTGSIPSGLWNMRNLVELDVSYNILTGPIQAPTGTPTAPIQILKANYNQLTLCAPPPSQIPLTLTQCDLSNNLCPGSAPCGAAYKYSVCVTSPTLPCRSEILKS
jgi:Leucine-rich repeat (LRR) protein